MDRPSNPTMLLGDDATEQVPIDAIVQLFGQDCFTVSDLRQVGLPLVFVSPSFESVTGYEPEEAIGRDLGFLRRDDTEQQGNQLLRESIAQGAPCTVILRNYRADGTLFWNEQQHYPLKSVSGRVTHLVTVQRDVTERINALMSLEVGETLAARIQSDGRWFGYSYLIKDDDEVSMVWASKACVSIPAIPVRICSMPVWRSPSTRTTGTPSQRGVFRCATKRRGPTNTGWLRDPERCCGSKILPPASGHRPKRASPRCTPWPAT